MYFAYDCAQKVFTSFVNYLEYLLQIFIVKLTNYLPVKVIRDDKGVPFLYRYHLFSLTNDGPGMCIHRFVKSDPERGYHDHPWDRSLSVILCGNYEERILNDDKITYNTYRRNRWTLNYLNGVNVYHRVMVEDGKDVWTLFMFQKRSKTWGMVSLEGKYKQMSTAITDQDGGWWNHVKKGLGLHERLKLKGNVVASVDIIIVADNKILLIKRGKNPYRDHWAFPGGRIEQDDPDMLESAYRELKEETNLTKDDITLEYAKTIGNSTRDPRGFSITNVFIGKLDKKSDKVKAGDDAVDFEWFELNSLPELAFDHKNILDELIISKMSKNINGSNNGNDNCNNK